MMCGVVSIGLVIVHIRSSSELVRSKSGVLLHQLVSGISVGWTYHESNLPSPIGLDGILPTFVSLDPEVL